MTFFPLAYFFEPIDPQVTRWGRKEEKKNHTKEKQLFRKKWTKFGSLKTNPNRNTYAI